MKRVGFIFGGRSGEHEVSLMSAAEVIRAAEKADFGLSSKKGKEDEKRDYFPLVAAI